MTPSNPSRTLSKVEWFGLCTCVLLLWSAAANVGVGLTGFWLGVPFAPPLVYLAWHLTWWRFLTAIALAFTPLAVGLSVDAASSRFHYPSIGSNVTVPEGWGYRQYPSDRTNYLVSREDLARRHDPSFGPPPVIFSEATQLTVRRVITQHPSFILHYEVLLADGKGKLYQISEREFLQAVASGRLVAPELVEITSLHRTPVKWLGNLMWWPLAPLYVPVAIVSFISGPRQLLSVPN